MRTNLAIRNSFFVLLLSFLLNGTSHSQQLKKYEEFKPFYGIQVKCMAMHPSGEIFLGTIYGDIYKADHDCNLWSKVLSTRTKIELPEVINIVFDNNGNIYAATNYGLYKSLDIGKTWSCIYRPQVAFFSFEIDDNGFLYAGMSKGLFVSYDGGINWKILFESDMIIRSITVKNNIIYAAVDQLGINISKDGGNSWEFKSTKQGFIWDILPLNDNEILITMSFPLTGLDIPFTDFYDGILKTTDGGNNWSVLNNGLTTNYITSLHQDKNNNIYAGGNFGRLFKSTDRGLTWETLTSGMVGPEIRSIITEDDKIILGVNRGGGVIVSNDFGKAWNYSSYGLEKQKIRSIILADSHTYIFSINPGIFSYNTQTDEFNGMNGDQYSVGMNSNFTDGEIVGIVKKSDKEYTIGSYQGRISFTKDFGKAWQKVDVGENLGPMLFFKGNQTGEIFFSSHGYRKGVYHSDNYGATWSLLPNPDISGCRTIQIDDFDEYYLGSSAFLFKSADLGLNWEYQLTFDNTIEDILKIDENNLIVLIPFAINVTNDNGVSWDKIELKDDSNKFIIKCNALLSLEDRVLLGTESGLYESFDLGRTWSKRNDEMSELSIYKFIKTENGVIFAVTNNGTYELVNFDITDVQTPELPTEYVLNQNFPNPFNPTTKIKYQIPEAGIVTLKVYDIIGGEVATLVDEYKASGSYESDFNAEHLSSGIYFYTLRSNKYSAVKKMILLK